MVQIAAFLVVAFFAFLLFAGFLRILLTFLSYRQDLKSKKEFARMSPEKQARLRRLGYRG